MSSDCIFCKIIDGSIPSAKVYEDGSVVSFLDIAPVNPCHCLIVPRRHVTALLELTEAELHACVLAAQKVASAVLAVTGAPGFNLLQNNGACAGQVVQHCHFHVIPRTPTDGFKFGWRQLKYAEGQIEDYRKRIVAKI